MMNLPRKILTTFFFMLSFVFFSPALFSQTEDNPIVVSKDELPVLERLKTSRDNPVLLNITALSKIIIRS